MSLFEKCNDNDVCSSLQEWKIFVDGASRGNPGPAACGIVIYCNNTFVKSEGYYLGNMTNNQAEYMGLVLGLCNIVSLCATRDVITIVSDSQLLVRQMQKIYKVKNNELIRLHTIACNLLKNVTYSFEHVLREYNQQADKAANDAFDTKKKVPDKFIEMMKLYESMV